ncbi:MAG: hypothetical protein GC161_03935 [Planctomycetaceae bacterium]|nr:hypothetical protein [Planctomycetaceae bacterium]
MGALAWALVLAAAAQDLLPGGPVDSTRPAPEAVREDTLPADAPAAWTFESESLVSGMEGDAKYFVIRAPVLKRGRETVRATWAIVWTDEDVVDGLIGNTGPDLRVEGRRVLDERSAQDRTRTIWDKIEEAMFEVPQLSKVREFYMEGPVEYFIGEDRVAFADAAYIDMIDRLGWIADTNYEMIERVGGSRFAFKVQADWLRLARDGSLTSSDARLTTCEFADPHFFITTGRLRLVPTEDPDRPVRVLARRNAIRIGDRLRIPLPPVDGLIDEEGDLTIGGLQVGESPRFGTVVGLEYNRDVREEIGERVNRFLRGDPENFRSRLRLSAAYLGSRGVLLDFGLRLRSAGIYEWNSDLGLVPDSAEDKGLVRVPEEDRPDLRTWFRSRGRYHLDKDEWVDLTISAQTDPGVQAEFFEDDYLRFAERRSYVHWRKAEGADYKSVTLGGSLDSFRTEVQPLPTILLERQRVPIADLGFAPLLYGASTTAGVYDRTEGDPAFEAPFDDGFGQLTVLRADHRSRLETPIPLGALGASLVPFVDGRATGWSEDGEDEGALARAAAIVGARLSTVFWRRTEGGGLQQLVPTLEIRRDAIVEEGSGTPLDLLDGVDESLEGQFTTAGLRGRWFGERWPFELDVDVRATHGSELSDGEPSGWRPLGVFARFESEIAGVPIAATHDGRYDTDTGDTPYSRTQLGLQPTEDWNLRAGFTQGTPVGLGEPFEAAFFGAIYRFSPKWEFEGRQQISLRESDPLDTRVILRRFGHDVVFEIGVSERAGEGGTSISFRVRPILTAKRRPPVLLPD